MAKRTKGRANGEGSIYEYPKGSGIWFAQIMLENGRSKRRQVSSQREARENQLYEPVIDRGAFRTLRTFPGYVVYQRVR